MRARLLFLACLACFAWGCAEAQHPGDESSSADDLPRNTHHRTKKKKKVAHKAHRDEDDDDAPKKKAKKSSDEDDEDAPKKPVKKVAAKKSSDDDDDAPKKPVKKAKKSSEDDDEDAPKKPVKKAVAKKDDDDEDAPKKPVKKVVKKDDDDEDAPKKPAKKVVAKKDDDDEDAPKKPVKKVVAKKNPHSESPDEDEDAPKKPIKKVVAKKPAEDDEDAPKKPGKKVAAKKSTDDEDEVAPKKPVAKHTGEDEPKITDDEDEATAKPKPVAVKAKTKPKSDEDEVVVKRPATKPSEEDKPKPEEPPKKQRSIEEDVAIDDPLAGIPPPRAVASADEGGEDAAQPGTTSDAVVVATDRNPSLQDRPLTTPAGQLDLHAGLPINVLTLTDAAGISSSSTSEGFALGVAYGFNAKGEVGLDYTLGLSPGKLEGPATLHGAYSFARGKLDFAAAAALGIDFYDTVDSMTMATSSKTAASFQLGAWVRYHATPTISIFSGLPAMPNASASLSKLAFALPLASYQIQIGLSDRGTSAVTLPIGLGYQASPKLYAFASLNLANIRIANTANAFLFKDYIPIAVGGFYNFDTFSLGASLADDLKQGLGYLRFELVARYLLH